MALNQQEAIETQPKVATAEQQLAVIKHAVDAAANGGTVIGGSVLQACLALNKTVADLCVRLAADIGD